MVAKTNYTPRILLLMTEARRQTAAAGLRFKQTFQFQGSGEITDCESVKKFPARNYIGHLTGFCKIN